jgi:hypothetical protein
MAELSGLAVSMDHLCETFDLRINRQMMKSKHVVMPSLRSVLGIDYRQRYEERGLMEWIL